MEGIVRRLDKHLLGILFIFAVVGLLLVIWEMRPSNSVKADIGVIPKYFKGWQSVPVLIGTNALNIIQPDTYLSRNYTLNGKTVNVFIGYYQNLDKSDLIHSPLVCYPGSGWVIQDDRDFSLTDKDRILNFRRLKVNNGNTSSVVLYAYTTNDLTTGSLVRMRLHLMASSILKNTSTNAFIRFSSNIVDEDETGTLRILSSFITDYKGYIDEFLVSTRRPS